MIIRREGKAQLLPGTYLQRTIPSFRYLGARQLGRAGPPLAPPPHC
jgi:hypothetical protein